MEPNAAISTLLASLEEVGFPSSTAAERVYLTLPWQPVSVHRFVAIPDLFKCWQ